MPKEHIAKSMGMKYIIQPNIPLKKVGFSAKIWSVESDRTDHKQCGATVRLTQETNQPNIAVELLLQCPRKDSNLQYLTICCFSTAGDYL